MAATTAAGGVGSGRVTLASVAGDLSLSTAAGGRPDGGGGSITGTLDSGTVSLMSYQGGGGGGGPLKKICGGGVL